jgi:pimeloyl-ACP methyl ester carboxylesterase
MPRVDVGSLSIFCEQLGAGEPVVLLTGLGGDLAGWLTFQAPALVRAGYRAVLIDNRDAGRSDLSPVPRYTMRDLAGDTARVIETLGLAPAHVLGWSMGGMIAQELAIRHPHAVRSLTLYGTSAGDDPFTNAWVAAMALIRSKLDGADYARATCPWLFAHPFIERPGTMDGYAEDCAANPYPQPEAAYARQCAAILAHSTSARLAAIRAPTHVIVGEQDITLPPRLSRHLAGHIAGAALTVLPGVGHAAAWEAPGAFNSAVLEFLGRVPGAAGR